MTSAQVPVPLTWSEARLQLRSILEKFLNDPHPPRRIPDNFYTTGNNRSTYLARLIERDFDIYFGALVLSLALLVTSAFSLSASIGGVGEKTLKASASQKLYQSELVASLILTFGSLASLWMVRRRNFLSLNDSYYSRRREVFRLLRSLNRLEEKNPEGKSNLSSSSAPDTFRGSTSLNDVYPVYRREVTFEDRYVSRWTRIPSLLLVRGDYVALKVGDIAPANCYMMENGKLSVVKLNAGEAVSLEVINQTASEVIGELPVGRSTLSGSSPHLLTLCNNMRIYWVEEAPIGEFLRRPQGML